MHLALSTTRGRAEACAEDDNQRSCCSRRMNRPEFMFAAKRLGPKASVGIRFHTALPGLGRPIGLQLPAAACRSSSCHSSSCVQLCVKGVDHTPASTTSYICTT